MPLTKHKHRCELISKLYFYRLIPTNALANNNTNGCELISKLYFYRLIPTNIGIMATLEQL